MSVCSPIYTSNVCEPNVVTLLNQTPILEWYMARCVVENKHQKDTCNDEIGRRVQNIDTILSSRVNTIRRAYAIT